MFKSVGQDTLARISIENQARNIPILSAVANNQLKKVKELIAKGANVNVSAPGGGKTALHIAVENNNEQIIELLIAAKANVNATTQSGIPPLHVAAQEGSEKIVIRLLQAKANVNARSNEGLTALHEAASAGQREAVRALLKFNADPTIKDNRYHLTAANLANEKGHTAIVDMLVSKMNYEQNFIQNINYILFNHKRIFSVGSNSYRFIDKLSSEVFPLNNGDEVFGKISDALKMPEYGKLKETLTSMHQLLMANMKKYNKNKAAPLTLSKEIVSVLTRFGLGVKRHDNSVEPLTIILDYGHLPSLK